jgi:LAS superfamily LD-carboxypeptidase LdcB
LRHFISITLLLIFSLLFFNLGSIYATSGIVVEKPNDQLVLVDKTYQLPKGSIPESLVTPNVAFSGDAEKLRAPAADALERMFAEAENSNIKLRAASGYRLMTIRRTYMNTMLMNMVKNTQTKLALKQGIVNIRLVLL